MSPHVLVVDDSLTVRMDLREAFEAHGLQVLDCGTVAEARDAIARLAFGVVVLDIQLPDGDGISLLEELRGSPLNGRASVLLLSTEADVRDRVRGLTRGADDYVGKPYDASYLVARTRELLGIEGTRSRASGRTVLLVDDSATYRAHLGAALEEAGYRVVGAETGEAGLLAAAGTRPDAVILDAMLPGIDGQTVLRRLKLDAGLRRTPVLMLTGSGRREHEVSALEAGADAFAQKGEETQTILARLAAMIRGTETGPATGPVTSGLGPKRILVVDDSETCLQDVSLELRRDGYDVAMARSGAEALELLDVQPVDCVLLDLRMPGLSGEDTCRLIRRSRMAREVPVIVLTTVPERVGLTGAVDAGADDYVTKSGDFDALRARVRAQLRRRQIEKENEEIHERTASQERAAAEARAARELDSVRAALLADLERKNLELREADRRKNEFLGTLSHELRNPLTPIHNALWILAHADPAGPQATRARLVVDRQITHLSRLIDDLLDVTRISRGKVVLNRTRCDLRELLRLNIQDHELLLAERRIGMEVRLTTEPVLLDADPTRITQVIGNLLQNSAKFTASGGRIELSLQVEPGTAVISVSDTGIGIATEMLPRVFEPFVQADESLHRSQGGLGLGLALVKGLVEMHGGEVEARSEGLGRGSEFVIRLPFGATGGQREVETGHPSSSPRRRILVVDDNVDAADSLRDMLTLAGHEVAVAYDGPTGVEKARSFRPDIAICDIGLPGMDGYAVARAIRTDPTLSDTALVAFSGYARPDDQSRADEAGFDDHLAKPASLEQVERVISHTERREQGQPSTNQALR